jgi:hypothetical protein
MLYNGYRSSRKCGSLMFILVPEYETRMEGDDPDFDNPGRNGTDKETLDV